MIYFAQQGADGPIKIGFTSGDVRRRVSMLRTGSPEPISILATMEGDLALEGSLHRRFGNLRLAGEWFIRAGSLLAFIESEAVPFTASKSGKTNDHPLSRYRGAHGVSCAEMGRRLGLTRQSVNRIENGLQIPSTEVLRRVEGATEGDVTPNDMIAALPVLELGAAA